MMMTNLISGKNQKSPMTDRLLLFLLLQMNVVLRETMFLYSTSLLLLLLLLLLLPVFCVHDLFSSDAADAQIWDPDVDAVADADA